MASQNATHRVGWSKAIRSWRVGRTLYLSIPFTWLVAEAAEIAREHNGPVVAGGPPPQYRDSPAQGLGRQGTRGLPDRARGEAMKYRKRPVVVEAWQWREPEDYQGGVLAGGVYAERDCLRGGSPGPWRFYVITIHGYKAFLDDKDWITAEPDGEHHCRYKPDIFAATYEKVEDAVRETPAPDDVNIIAEHLAEGMHAPSGDAQKRMEELEALSLKADEQEVGILDDGTVVGIGHWKACVTDIVAALRRRPFFCDLSEQIGWQQAQKAVLDAIEKRRTLDGKAE